MGLENPTHIAIIVVILLLVFGAKRLPEIGKSLGEGMRGFKDSVTGGGSREPDALTPPAPVAAPPAPVAAPAPPAQAAAGTEAPPVPAQAPSTDAH